MALSLSSSSIMSLPLHSSACMRRSLCAPSSLLYPPIHRSFPRSSLCLPLSSSLSCLIPSSACAPIYSSSSSTALRLPLSFPLLTRSHSMSSLSSPSSSPSSLPPSHTVLSSPSPSSVSLLLTCEHAADALPPSCHWSPNDQAHFAGKHWAYDPGALPFLTEWKEDNQQGVAGVYSHFSRLYCDVNRPLGSPTMFRAEGDGRKVDLNVSISDAEKNKRISYCYIPYHEALHQLSLSHPNARLGLSLHSFTDNYEGQPRLTEIGVLYKDEEDRELCETLTKGLTASGYKAVVNDPWSGKDGFMFAAEKLKEAYMKRRKGSNAPYFHTIMFEFRQDLVMSKEWRKKVRQTIVNILQTQTNIFK